MIQARIVATALYYLTRILAIAYFATAASATISFLSGAALRYTTDDKYFEVLFPFTSQPFLRGDNSTWYIIEMVAFLFLYGLFFWLVGNIFKTFREKKLLTVKGIRRLKIFYLLNFLVPLPFLVLHLAFSYEVSIIVILTVLHAVVGVFAYFMAAIFRQGLKLQNEQDLFI